MTTLLAGDIGGTKSNIALFHVMGGKLSLADVLLFNAFANKLGEDEVIGEIPSHRREPFSSSERTNAALDAHPKLKAIVGNVAANPNVQRFLASRGKQGF